MNKYLRALGVYPTGALKMGTLKLLHGGRFHGPALCQVSPRTEFTVDRGATLSIGAGFKMRPGAVLRVRRGALDVGIVVGVKAGTQIPELCRMIQKRVGEVLAEHLGTCDLAGIGIEVNEIRPRGADAA